MKRKSKHGMGTYALVGGGVEFGETFEETAKREVMEEVGVEIENIKVLGLVNNIIESESHHSVAVIVAGTIKEGEPKNIEPDKCEEIIWHRDWSNLPEPIFTKYTQYVTKQMVDDYLNSIR